MTAAYLAFHVATLSVCNSTSSTGLLMIYDLENLCDQHN